jgi:hypothetical protein
MLELADSWRFDLVTDFGVDNVSVSIDGCPRDIATVALTHVGGWANVTCDKILQRTRKK